MKLTTSLSGSLKKESARLNNSIHFLAHSLQSALECHFGHTHFRPLQREIIESVISGQPTLAVLPTGAGKSLTYQLPALFLEGLTIVISPLISLIQDQVQELKRKGVAVGQFDSTLNLEQRAHELDKLVNGETTIFYTSPESLANSTLYSILKNQTVALVAIDEAHCISDWGHSFRPSYLYLPKLIRGLKPNATLALTATATRKTASEIRKLFKIKTSQQFNSSNIRSNLEFQISSCLAEQKDDLMLDTLSNTHRLPAIVYAMRQEQCEEVAHTLTQSGHKARSYHAGLNTSARAQVQDQFLNGNIDIVVATIAFGMGVDKPNIRTVIHYHLPKSPEGWMQESGRAGRDGKHSLCQLLACGDDLIPLENFVQAKQVSEQSLTNLIDSIYAQGRHARLSPYHTRARYGFHGSTLDILLARLEVSGKIKFTGTTWRYIWAWPVAGRRIDLSGYSKKIQQALEHIFSLGERYDTELVKEQFSLSAGKLWNVIFELRDTGDIVCKPSGWFWNYRIKLENVDPVLVTKQLLESFQKQRLTDLEKLEHVSKIATSRSCIPNSIAKWFGEKVSAPCGVCSSCLKQKRPRKLPTSPHTEVSDQQLETILELINSPKKRLRSNQQLTRFLCGISTPYLRHYWLTRNAHFGMLSEHPYSEVYAYSKALLNAQD